jgi:thiamine biosynthesis lipoprotein
MTTVERVDRRWRTTLAVTVRGDRAASLAPESDRIFRTEVERLEQVASRFRADSELARANAAAGTWVPVSRLLEELVEVAVSAAATTDGLVTPCLGHQVDGAGYRSWAAGEVPVLRMSAPIACDPDAWQHVEIAGGRLRTPADIQLDLGATAKAWLADEIAERIAEETGLDVVANMGGDLRAIGSQGPWILAVDHETPGATPHPIEVADAGLATSGQGGRRWRTTDGQAHHLIDPRSGRSADTRWWATSVLATTATAANTAATAAMLLDGSAPAWLTDRHLDAVLTAWDGSPQPEVVTLLGRWPDGRRAA